MRKRTFICDPLLPSREIHLIAGGSGAGKSTFACQLACDLINGGEFFGLPITRPQSVAYLAFDRSEDGMYDTFRRTTGQTTIPFPFYSTTTSPEFSDPAHQEANGAIKRIQELHPDLDVLFLDGIGMAFSGDSSSLTDVARFVKSMVKTLHRLTRPLTLFANHHMGKVKKGNEYAAARSRIHGSVAWAATSETVILIEPENEEDPENPHRRITLCPRNAPERVLTFAFDEDGRLVPASDGTLIEPRPKYHALDLALSELNQEELTTAEIEATGDALKLSRATTTRYIAELCEAKKLHRLRRGIYQHAGLKILTLAQRKPS